MNALADARTDLAAALTAGLAELLPAHRVHTEKPAQPATPMVWIGPFAMIPDTIGDGAVPVVALDGTIYAPLDGDHPDTDHVQAALWQAVDTVATPTGSTVGPFNVGGPTLNGVTFTFRMVISAASLCPLELVTTP